MTQAHPTPRPDLITPIHKGLRRALFDTALALARTDFTAEAEVAAAQEAVATCFEYLREHAEHEDRHTSWGRWGRGSPPPSRRRACRSGACCWRAR